MKERGKSLYLAIVVCFFSTIGLLLLSMAGLLLPQFSRLLENNAVDRTRETMMQGTNSLEIYVNNMLSTLHFASTLLPGHEPAQETEYHAQIDLLRRSNKGVSAIVFFGEDGRLFHSTRGQLSVPQSQVTDMEWFQKARSWQETVPYFSAPHVQHIFDSQVAWVITLSRAVNYTEGGVERTGVLLMDIDFSEVASLLSDIVLGSSGYVYLLDTNDQILHHPRMQLLYAGLAHENVDAVAEQIVGTARDVADGRERVLMINTVYQTRWRLVGVAYFDEILLLQRTFTRLFTLSLICGALLSLGVAALTGYYVTRPIHLLQNKMRQVESGDLNISIAEQGFQEVRALSASFNLMLGSIRDLMDQVVLEQEAKRLYELNALQAQINPHFLYNTLDSIIWMEERGHSKDAIIAVSALAKLFRISISQGRAIITVQEELEHVRNYLIIQKMRFKNKFTYEIHASEGALHLCTVKLIVQPLVENAIHHAIDAYDDSVLHIVVRASHREESLMITVADDGIGMPPEKVESILRAPAGKTGIGLRNVHERIQLTCGRNYGLRVESVEDEGTIVTVLLPVGLEGNR
ncbi:MAG: sensor histidine kinase [Clostridia bacterium]|nr:sensor histidine kinase [Clostridia bacterium]